MVVRMMKPSEGFNQGHSSKKAVVESKLRLDIKEESKDATTTPSILNPFFLNKNSKWADITKLRPNSN